MATETVGEWKAAKQGQAERFLKLDPSLSLDAWGDYGTKFILVHVGLEAALTFGQLPRDDIRQERVDLTDEQIAAWAAPLRKPA